MNSYDCIFLPGGGLLPDGSLPPWTRARLDRALELSGESRYIACLSGGTVHKPPPLDGDGFPLFESRVAGSYLADQGAEPDRILTEISSYDTIGNAYFSRLLFSDPGQFTKLLVITSQFHLSRVQAAFKWIYRLTPVSCQYQLSFEATPNRGLSPSALSARHTREKASLAALSANQRALKSLKSFQAWFYTEHAAYALQSPPERLNGDVLESY